MKSLVKSQAVFYCAVVLLLLSSQCKAEPLSSHLKRLTSILASRNMDSLRILIDSNRILVEIPPKEGAYLSPAQALGVLESFFNVHPIANFSYILVREDGDAGIAIGTLATVEAGRKNSYRVNFGFQKNRAGKWLLNRITIH